MTWRQMGKYLGAIVTCHKAGEDPDVDPCNALQSHVTWDEGSVRQMVQLNVMLKSSRAGWGHEEGGFTLDMELCKHMITQVDREALTATRQTSADVTKKILPLTHP